jgi:hypothetical protein
MTPPQAREPAERLVSRHELTAVLDRQRGKVSIGDRVAD